MFFSINWLTFQCYLGANLRRGSIKRFNLLRFFFLKKLTGPFKIVQSVFIAPFYGKLQEKEIVT